MSDTYKIRADISQIQCAEHNCLSITIQVLHD